MFKMTKDSIGCRMKNYERVFENYLPKRIPVIIRIDGRAFHKVTKNFFKKGWDINFTMGMVDTAEFVMRDIQGCSFCYLQSDEISFLLTDYKTINTDPWFDYNLNKLVSISASLASARFSKNVGTEVAFDSRVFSVPEDDICNYFIWRQQDATRNAIQMLGQEHFSHKQLHKKNCNEVQEILFKEKGINFNDCPVMQKRGICIVKGEGAYLTDDNIPIFSKDRNFIEKFVFVRKD